MDTAVAMVKLGIVWMALVTMVLSLWLSYTVVIEARSAARSAAFAAAERLGGAWGCEATGTDWGEAETAAARASGDRLAGNSRLIVTDFGLTADPATCTVLAALHVVPVVVGGWWRQPVHAVACAPTRASGLPLPSACGQRT